MYLASHLWLPGEFIRHLPGGKKDIERVREDHTSFPVEALSVKGTIDSKGNDTRSFLPGRAALGHFCQQRHEENTKHPDESNSANISL